MLVCCSCHDNAVRVSFVVAVVISFGVVVAVDAAAVVARIGVVVVSCSMAEVCLRFLVRV